MESGRDRGLEHEQERNYGQEGREECIDTRQGRRAGQELCTGSRLVGSGKGRTGSMEGGKSREGGRVVGLGQGQGKKH